LTGNGVRFVFLQDPPAAPALLGASVFDLSENTAWIESVAEEIRKQREAIANFRPPQTRKISTTSKPQVRSHSGFITNCPRLYSSSCTKIRRRCSSVSSLAMPERS
jgi:hypothetical protein